METYFNDLLELLKQNLNNNKPGEWAQKLMMPEGRVFSPAQGIEPIPSSVLIALYEKDREILFPIIRRPIYNGLHSGQMGFPGGKFEHKDLNLTQTALRESHEEIGINGNDIIVLGTLTKLYIPITNMQITPVLGYLKAQPNYIINSHEVDALFNVSMNDILNQSKKTTEKWIIRGDEFKVPFYHIQDQKIWGATAMILSELEQLLIQCKYPIHFT